jgi:hypothetical protein
VKSPEKITSPVHGYLKKINVEETFTDFISSSAASNHRWVLPFLQAMKALRESRGIALLCY